MAASFHSTNRGTVRVAGLRLMLGCVVVAAVVIVAAAGVLLMIEANRARGVTMPKRVSTRAWESARDASQVVVDIGAAPLWDFNPDIS